MTENKNETPSTDWSQLAKDALDIWQNHLTSLATDPKAKEEMARFVTPMTEAMTGWSSVMQQGMHQMMKMAATAAEQAQAYAPPETESETTSETADAAAESAGTASEPSPLKEESVAAPENDAPVAENESEQQVVMEEAVRHDVSVTPAALDEPARDDERVASERVSNDSSQRAESAPESGRTLTPDGSRSLAELAGRLAVLERELDHLRPRTRRKDAAAEPLADAADERVAGANQGTNSR